MKKLFYVAVMALTLGLLSGCQNGIHGSDYYKDGKVPEFDYEKGTVNGKKYDNETEKCWKVTGKQTLNGQTQTGEQYFWCTEWAIVAQMEEAMYHFAKQGEGSGSYSYSSASQYKDSESCLLQNIPGGCE